MDLAKVPTRWLITQMTLGAVLALSLTAPVGAETPPAAAWVQRHDGAYGLSDVPVGMALDGDGNLYVVGSSFASVEDFDVDYSIVKHGPDGTELWSARYDGPASSRDEPAALAVDTAGNAYVTGRSFATATGYDLATIKYDPAGTRLWVKRFNASGNEWENASDLALDPDGNLIVLGDVYPVGLSEIPSNEMVLVKYDPSGNELWAVRYGYTIEADTFAAALAVDDWGNIFVVGHFEDHSQPAYVDDLLVAKFDGSGTLQWVETYDSPTGGIEEGVAIAVDAAGNAYVAGVNRYGFDSNYVTIMYDAAGAQQWVAIYDGTEADSPDEPSAIAVDSLGNVLVTGESQGDCLTVKYDPSGTELWAEDHGSGVGRDLALDTSNNVYVTGYSWPAWNHTDYLTIKYDGAGTLQWSASYDGPESAVKDKAQVIALDEAGNVYVTGDSVNGHTTSGVDFATIKYDGSGNELWVATFDGPAKDVVRGMAVDFWGNAHVVGTSGISAALVRYDPGGVIQWSETVPGARLNAVTLDDSGHVYVAGRLYGDFLTRKYDGSGTLLWSATYDGAQQGSDEAVALAVDAAGNVYVTGDLFAAGGLGEASDYGTVKYDSSGNQLWVARRDGGSTQPDQAAAIGVDGWGNVAVTGSSFGPSGGYDYLTVMYDPSGSELWSARYDGPGSSRDLARALAIDEAGSLYVAGASAGTGGYDYLDYATIKYDPLGNQQWVTRYDGASGLWDEATAMTLDGSDRLLVTGGSQGASYHDFATVLYDGTGLEQWVALYDGTAGKWDGAAAIALDVWGDIYVTGRSWGVAEDYDYATVKYDRSGAQIWVSRYDGPVSDTDTPVAIGLDGLGNVYVSGTSDGGGSGYDWATLELEVAALPQGAILDIADEVAELVAAGALNEGQGNALTVKLLQAVKKLDQGAVVVAVNCLEAFVNQVTDLIAEGELLPAQGDPLLAAADQILTYLEGPAG